MSRTDRLVLRLLQVLVLGLPFLLGGNRPWAMVVATPIALLLLVLTLRAERRSPAPGHGPGLAALAAFCLLALATTLPLPPSLLGLLTPATARIYGDTLPGWPSAASWTSWRSLAIDPYAVWREIGRVSIAFTVFAVIVAYPWKSDDFGEDARAQVTSRLLLTLFAGGALLATVALLQEVAGNGRILWITGEPSESGRASGPFVNPNHFAAWLEMVIPAALAYALTLAGRIRRRLVSAADTGRRMGVRPRRAWVAALVKYQTRLWPPLVAGAAVLLMLVAHFATGSRGGAAALLIGLGVAAGGALLRGRDRDARRRLLAVVLVLAFIVGSGASLTLWALAESGDTPSASGDADEVEASLASRLAVSVEGLGVVRDFPLFGTGLGTWLHAFRPYQAPPVEGGIWDHAHDDYVELAAETGAAGLLIALCFCLAVARAARGQEPEGGRALAKRPAGELRNDRPAGFELPEWYAALADTGLVRWGLIGGVAAILVHSLVDFGLRMPANLVALMAVLGLLVLSGRPERSGRSPALALLLVVLCGVTAVQLANLVRIAVGATPLSPEACLTEADLMFAEQGEPARPEALRLIKRAIDLSPASRDAHEALANTLGPGAEGDSAQRRAVALEPSEATTRDALGLRLWAEGQQEEAARELEESMYRDPFLVSHSYLGGDDPMQPTDSQQLIRALGESDTLRLRLAAIEPGVAAAIERGLRRALSENAAGAERAGIVEDLVTLLEARERWADAAQTITAESARNSDVSNLPRAAHDYLQARDYVSAEKSLMAALLRNPDDGSLYQSLAVDIYAARGDFDSASQVLKSGEQNAVDLLPIYQGVDDVLQQRESIHMADFVGPVPPPRLLDAKEVP